jgi:hypothetical protein
MLISSARTAITASCSADATSLIPVANQLRCNTDEWNRLATSTHSESPAGHRQPTTWGKPATWNPGLVTWPQMIGGQLGAGEEKKFMVILSKLGI